MSITSSVPSRRARIRISGPALRASITQRTGNGLPAVGVAPSSSSPRMVESVGSTSTASVAPTLCGAVAWQFAGLTGAGACPPQAAASARAASAISGFRISS